MLGYRYAELLPVRQCAYRQSTARLLLFATPVLRAAGFADNDALVAVVCQGGIAALNALVCVHLDLLALGLKPQQLCALGAQPEGAAALHAVSRAAPALMAAGSTATELIALAARNAGLPGAVAAAVPQLRELELTPEETFLFAARCGDAETLARQLADVALLASAGVRGAALAAVLARRAVADELPVLLRHAREIQRNQVSTELVWAALDQADGGRTLKALLENLRTLQFVGFDDRQLVAAIRDGAQALGEVARAAGRFINGANSADEAVAAAEALLASARNGEGTGNL